MAQSERSHIEVAKVELSPSCYVGLLLCCTRGDALKHELQAGEIHLNAAWHPESGLAMIVNDDRVVYRGLLGAPSRRLAGAVAVYVADHQPFSLRLPAGERRSLEVAVVPPNVAHEIRSADRLIGVMLIEPESVDPCALKYISAALSCDCGPAERHALREAFRRWVRVRHDAVTTTDEIDGFFFGRRLPPRKLDPRIDRAVHLVRANHGEPIFAATCADVAGLSFSRFVHLFKDQIGLTFRTYCAWKRARAILPHVAEDSSLTQLAMSIGYADSAHFSRSIRRIFGLRPKDIVAGSRSLSVVSSPGAENNNSVGC